VEPHLLPSGTVRRETQRRGWQPAAWWSRGDHGNGDALLPRRRPSPPVVSLSPIISICPPLPSPHSGSARVLFLFLLLGVGAQRAADFASPSLSSCSSWLTTGNKLSSCSCSRTTTPSPHASPPVTPSPAPPSPPRGACVDPFSFPSLLRACAHMLCFRAGSTLHTVAIRLGVDADLFIRMGLIQFYGRCGTVSTSRAPAQ
jgi:hypothetical protein